MLFYSDQDKTDPRSLDVSRETFPATLGDTRSLQASRLAYEYAAWSLARLSQQYPCLSGRVCLKSTPACLAGGASLERSGSLARWSWSDEP
jgi:hypothetical protein